MRIAALIEITATDDGVLPAEVIARAYRASVFAPVVLVMADELRRAVERALDPLVPQLPVLIPGVRFVDVRDEDAVVRFARRADLVEVSSQHLRQLLSPVIDVPAAAAAARHGAIAPTWGRDTAPPARSAVA